ncbi:radical sam family protein [Heliomicrobium modesticaldum Ice1]|uniref:Radical sam family protein n=1 Tax=Heliobacterium modesticaldum (strain ATCC 51547 / Ice1) TaxID=498761 RepID=B0TDM0_HELMI|nr:TIGR01212 family radical SAM protein [Heliomicrobium modesticaldum]ABZ85545.1 radical sam family protein [Heliomicrobium modesticaldum Ice1]
MTANNEKPPRFWGDKRYHSWNQHLRARFGEKVMKVSLNAGLTCPNRDGTAGRGGCVFCCPQGSGACAGDPSEAIRDQFRQVRERLRSKWSQGKYIAYFQAFSNTYGDPRLLRRLYEEALAQEGVVGLSLSTRPDCLPDDVLDLLVELNGRTYLWVELGLQSIHDDTLRRINRGHDAATFYAALEKLRARGIRVCVHIIYGLPGEGEEAMLETGRAVAAMDVQGVKFHSLHVMKGTRLAEWHAAGQVPLLDRDSYIRLVVDTLEILPPEMVIQRLTGDAPRELLVAPQWISRKWGTLQGIDRLLEERNSWQGKNYDCALPKQSD